MLGNCGVFAGRTGSAEPEIGYEIRRSCQGRGLATEAARAVLDDALASGISRVWATIRPHNTASLRVAAKIGMTLQHTKADSRGPLAYLARPRQGEASGPVPRFCRSCRSGTQVRLPRPPPNAVARSAPPLRRRSRDQVRRADGRHDVHAHARLRP